MLDSDPIYTHKARLLMYAVACILPLAYAVGLLFTLKTHTDIYNPPDEDDSKARRFFFSLSSLLG
jgi:Ca2+:H+ antiporter